MKMERNTEWWPLAATALLVCAQSAAAADDELKIAALAEGLSSVEVYRDIEAETIAGEISASAFPLSVYGISENLMIRVKTADVEGWVFPFHVKADFNVEDIGPCNYSISAGEAAPRAIGKNCKNDQE